MRRIRRLPSTSYTASSKRLLNPTAPSTPTAGKVTSVWRRLAIGTNRLSGNFQPSASELLPRVHRVAALERWLISTHQGAVSREHLDYYLDEYTFRFNRRRSRHRGKLFTGLSNKPRPLAPLPIQRWSNTYAAGGSDHKIWGSRE